MGTMNEYFIARVPIVLSRKSAKGSLRLLPERPFPGREIVFVQRFWDLREEAQLLQGPLADTGQIDSLHHPWDVEPLLHVGTAHVDGGGVPPAIGLVLAARMP